MPKRKMKQRKGGIQKKETKKCEKDKERWK